MTSTLRFLASVPLLMALALQTAQAQPMGPPGSTYPLAPYQVLAMVRSNGFEPLSRPLRRGAANRIACPRKEPIPNAESYSRAIV